MKATAVDHLLKRFGPQELTDEVMWEALVGDALLSLGVVLTQRAFKPQKGKRRVDTTTPRSNAFLAAQITQAWGGEANFKTTHELGTAVECALYRLYQIHGMDAVLDFARELIQTSENTPRLRGPTYVY